MPNRHFICKWSRIGKKNVEYAQSSILCYSNCLFQQVARNNTTAKKRWERCIRITDGKSKTLLIASKIDTEIPINSTHFRERRKKNLNELHTNEQKSEKLSSTFLNADRDDDTSIAKSDKSNLFNIFRELLLSCLFFSSLLSFWNVWMQFKYQKWFASIFNYYPSMWQSTNSLNSLFLLL